MATAAEKKAKAAAAARKAKAARAKKSSDRKTTNTNNGTSKQKEFRKSLDLDYSTSRFVQRTKNSVSFYCEDKNSGNEVLVCENIDKLETVHEGLTDLLDL